MISELNLRDELKFNELGLLVNNNFDKLYSLKDIVNKDYAHVFGYYYENNLVGFIHIEQHYEVIDIINIVVDLPYRRKQIATKLINYIVNNFESDQILLEVRADNNPAIKLYEKIGFKKINVRKNYYGEVDAIIMEGRFR